MPRILTPNLDYIGKHYAVQDALLSRIDKALHDIGMPIHVHASEGKLFQLLIRMHGVKTVVEIGTLAGYSAIWMARALPQGGHLYACNKEPEHIKMAQGFFDESDVKDRITQLGGDAHQTLASLNSKGPFDMVFIDADKEGYDDYLNWSEKNIRKGGLIVADNTFLFDTIALDTPPDTIAKSTWQSFRRFNERLADPKKYFSALIPTQDGLTVAIKLF